LVGALLQCSTYPGTIFQGVWRGVLFTIIPAAYINLAPVYLIGDFSATYAAVAIAVSLGSLVISRAIFYRGLRRYESGSTAGAQL
jgi:ABC-2 type transport system permease protein